MRRTLAGYNGGMNRPLTVKDRITLFRWSAWPWLRAFVVDPTIAIAQRVTPLPLLLRRLEPLGDGWYRIPNWQAGVHVSRRLGGKAWREDELVRIVDVRATAVGWFENGRIESEAL